MTAAEILALITFLQNAAPEIASMFKALFDRLKGATPEEVAALGHALNATAISEIQAELGK